MTRHNPLLCLLLVSAAAPCPAQRTLSADAYLDKLHGMWLGQLIGNFTGLPTEGAFPGAAPNPAASVPWVLLPVWRTDDDTDIEYVIQHAYAVHGLSPTDAQLRDEWMQHIPLGTVYVSNQRARWLMDQGVAPPETGTRQRNELWWAIDPQLTNESLGAIAPGLRQWALDRSGQWSRATSEGTPVHAAQFFAAMYAAAAFESDVPTLVQLGLEAIPQSSRAAAIIRDVVAWHQQDLLDSQPDWRGTRQLIYTYYQGPLSFGRSVSWYDSILNLGTTTLALLYGNGDFEQTVQIATLAGWDCDNAAATSGGLIGLVRGYSGLPAWMLPQCGDVYRNFYRLNLPNPGPLPQDDSVYAIAQRWQALAEQVIVAQGGWIADEPNGRTYHIPAETPLTTDPEKPDPPGAAGVVGQFRQGGETVALSASVTYNYAPLDRYNIAGIADGITDPTYTNHAAYWTDDGNPAAPAGDEFYQIAFPRPARVRRIVFHEGDLRPLSIAADPNAYTRTGGYFETLTAEVLVSGSWIAPADAQQSEPLDAHRAYQAIAFDFAPLWCDAIRIRGQAGGSEEFTTIMELEAVGFAPPLCPGDADRSGHVDQDDLDLVLFNFGQSVTEGESGDVDGDGQVTQDDLDEVLFHFGDACA